MLQKSIPIFRIFDIVKAKEFYIDWLGFTVQFEHQFDPGAPLYIGIKREDIEIHLSEHHGDCTPGSNAFIVCNEVEKYYEELQSRPYKYYNPSLKRTFYNTNTIAVTDPFGNRLTFNEYLSEDAP